MYRNVLVAIELRTAPAEAVLRRARGFLADDATLLAIHVVEPQYVQYSVDPTFKGSLSRSLEARALEVAAQRLAELCEPFGIGEAHRITVLGRAADRIHAVARERRCDLIVIGAHDHTGLGRLLGSTAGAVLHGAPVDVATVRIDPEKTP